MRLWRIESTQYQDTALEGIGAQKVGGRWNLVNTAMVYLSTSLSLASYEKFVHMPRSAKPQGLIALGVEVPDGLIALAQSPRPLPDRWRAPEAAAPAMKWGTDWVNSGTSLAAAVPSILLPLDLYEELSEYNVLLNPLHPMMSQVEIAAAIPYSFDSRAWKDQ